MKKFWVSMMVLGLLGVHAESLQQKVETQSQEIKELKRQLAIKEQEVKILLITLKNAQEETIVASSGQQLEFNTIDNVTPTRVVLKPSMLSEMAIKEIGKLDESQLLEQPATVATQVTEHNGSVQTPPQNSTQVAAVTTEATKPTVSAPACDVVPTSVTAAVPTSENLPPMEYIKASKFELTKDAHIYYELGSEDYVIWPEGKRFTSNKKRGNWILVTGQITPSGWKRATQNFWVPQDSVRLIP